MPRELSKDPRQKRARAKRAAKKLRAEIAELHKPIEEWDEEELAMGRPRNKKGDFRGRPPQWITPEICDAARKRHRELVVGRLGSLVEPSLDRLREILDDDSTDDNGKPVVPASVKVDISKYLIDRLLGKPKQEIEGDISIRLQALLGVAMVNPDGSASQGCEQLPAGGDDDDDD